MEVDLYQRAKNNEEDEHLEKNQDGYIAEGQSSDMKTELSLCELLKKYFSIALPTVIQCSFQRATLLINTIYVGHINDVSKLAGVGLAVTISCILCLTILEGMNGAVETLVSQAYGNGQLRLCGVHLNRGRLILTAIFIPLATILTFSK